MRRILFIPFLFCALSLSAQSKIDTVVQLQNQLSLQKQEIKDLRLQLNDLSKTVKTQSHLIDSIQTVTQANSTNIKAFAGDLDTKIQKTQSTTNDGLAKLDKNLSKNKLYWILGSLVTLLLGGLIYWLLSKRISSSKTDVETQIKNTKQSLEEESVKLDNKLIEVLETQLKISQAEQTISNNNINEEVDHSLALKVADEIIRMQKNITRMDEGTKGLKPLVKGIERIQANFAANGYEMVNLLNTEYDDRMNIDVINFIDDDNIEKDKKIITKVIKPQVNYKGILIQRAQVDVSQN